MAEEQQGTTGSVSLDQRLEGKQPPAVRKFIQTVTSSGIPVRLVAETESPKPISVEIDSAETEQDPVIRINPTLLGRVAKTLGAEAYSSWSFLALTEEVVHFRYLKLLAQEAKDLGIGYKQHLKNETKRIASIIKRRRGLRQKLEKLYNNGEKFKNDFEMVFEFMRMIPQEKLTGSITEATYLDVESIIRAMEPQERRFVFRFIDAVRDFLYGITGRTSAETKFLRETADAIVRMSSRISRNLASPNEKLPVQMKYFEPAERKLVETKETREAAEKETKATTGLSNANLKFLQEYAKELGLKAPTAKKEMEVLENGKVVKKTLFFPTWKKPDYITAIKEKLKELGQKPKELGAAMPSMRFKTEYAFQQIDNKVGEQKGILKGLTVASDGTVPWETLKAKLQTHRFKGKGLSKAEADWVIPTLEALVRNGRVNVDQARQAMRALAESKLQVQTLTEKPLDETRQKENDQLVNTRFYKNAREVDQWQRNTIHQLENFAPSNAQNLMYEYILPKIRAEFDYENSIEWVFDERTSSWRATLLPSVSEEERLRAKDYIEDRNKSFEDQIIAKAKEPTILRNALEDVYKNYRKILSNLGAKTLKELSTDEVKYLGDLKQFYDLETGGETQEAGSIINVKYGLAIESLYNRLEASLEMGTDGRASMVYKPINPKPVGQMEEVREILIRNSGNKITPNNLHYHFAEDVVGFGRMYTTKQGNKTGTFLFEAQTDAAESIIEQAENPDFPFLAYEFSPIITALKDEDLLEALKKGTTSPDRITFDELGNIVSFDGDSKFTIAEHQEGTTYKVLGGWGLKLIDEIQKDQKLSQKLKPDLRDKSTQEVFAFNQMRKEAAPLVEAYESLVLKNAIANAVGKGHDFIAITDAETAAMTEGHDRVKEGMRVHYDPRRGSLHNLARKLTGDTGTPFDDGRSMYIDEQEEADRLERPPSVIRRYAKPNVTGVAYSLDKVKALGEESDIYNILGAALPTDRPYWLKPNGQVLDVEESALIDLDSIGSHSQAAVDYLNENEESDPFLTEWKLLDPFDRKEQQGRVVLEMLRRGWLRVVGDGFNLYFEGTPSKEQLDKLFEAAVENEVKLIQDLSGTTGRARSKTLYEPPLPDELGAAMPRHGFSTTRPRYLLYDKALPSSLKGLKQVKVLGGTHDVRLYQDKMGNKFAVKFGQTEQQYQNELASDNIYRILNYPVPASKLIRTEDGELVKVSAFVNGPTLGEFEREMKDSSEAIDEVNKSIANGLLIDAYLFNYDVLGQDKDNIVVAHEEYFDDSVISEGNGSSVSYVPYRIDNGGTLDTRATGLERNEPFFYDTFKRLQEKYPSLKLEAPDVVAQLSDLVLNSDKILNSIPEKLRPMMAKRLQWMTDQLSALDTVPAAAGQTQDEVSRYFEKLSKEMAAVEITRNEQGELINKATGKPSRLYTINTLGKVVGSEPKSEFRYRLERTPSFKLWFGDWENNPEGRATSKILDEAGEPWLLFHGTRASSRLFGQVFKDDAEMAGQPSSYPRKFAGNTFRGTWLSTSRAWAEEWAENTGPDQYDEQVVIPMYVKSTNPFDPNNPTHLDRLLNYLKEKRHDVDPVSELAIREGYDDWTLLETRFNRVLNKEGTDYVIPANSRSPNMETIYKAGDTEETRKRKFFSKMPYPALEAIINLGFDGMWAREKGLGESPLTEKQPLVQADRLFEAARSGDKNEEARARADLLGSINAYKARSIRTFLAFRNDGIKSAVNTGIFRSLGDKNKLRKRQNSQAYVDRVMKNPVTKWNEFVKDGVLYASYEPAQNLVTYAFASPSELSKNNIAKVKVSDGVYYIGERLAPPPRSSKREEMDILGSAMPRQFGVRLKDKMHADAYDRLKNLTYEPIPDAMVEAEAQAYLEKHGIRGAMEAALSKSSPLEYGSRELLAQIVMKKLEAEYAATKDVRILEDLVDFTDSFLSVSSEIGRALRALSFLTRLSKEGMLVMYRKKSDETNREIRDRFNEFFAKVKKELSTLPEGTIDKVLKNMEVTLGKADKIAAESRKKLAVNNTMTFWENFADQLGKSLVQKAESQLAEAEAEAEAKNQDEALGGEVAQTGVSAEAKKKAEEKIKNAKVINQAAQELSQNIRRMYMALAEEQGRRIRDPRVVTDEEFANKTEAELEQIHKEERTARQIKKFTDMLANWPKAKQAWQTAVDAIRTKTETNPDLAQMFNEFLDLSLDSPFTMPQLKRLLTLKGVKVEDLIRNHYQDGGLANNAQSLARELVEKAGIGAGEEGIGSDYQDETGFYKYKKPRSEDAKKEDPSEIEKIPSLSQRLANAIALQIQKYASDEATKKLDRLIKNFADKRLEPSLKRFAKRLVEYQALGLFNNSGAWNEFKKQEGLDKVKKEVMDKLVELVTEAEKLKGFRKDQKYADALSLIAYETQVNKWNWVKPWWYLSILSGATTQFVNLVGNFSNHLLMAGPLVGKAAFYSVKEPARAKAMMATYLRGLKNALYDAAYVMEFGVSGTRKTENPQFSRVAREYFELIAKNSPTKIGKVGGTSLAMIGRLMSSMDMLFYNLGKEAYLYEAAFIQAKGEGLSDKQAATKARELIFRDSEKLAALKAIAEEEGYVVDPKAPWKTKMNQKSEQLFRIQELADERTAQTENTKDLAIKGEIAGNELTFNEEPIGFLGMVHRQLSALMNRYGLVSYVVPFTRIVANVWNQGLDYTGFGWVRSKFLSKDLEGTAEEVSAKREMMRNRAKYGLAAVGILALLDRFTCGNYETFGFELCINGPGPKETAQRELLKNRLKWKPYSLFIKSKLGVPNGAYVSYLATPLAFGLGFLGTYNDDKIYRYFARKDAFDAQLAVALRASTMPFEMNFLAGLGDLFDILTPSNPESGLTKLKAFLGRLGSSLVVPNLARDIDQLSGLGGPRTSREGLLQAMFIANTPGVRQLLGTTEMDMLGKPAYMTSRLFDYAKKDALTEALIEKNALPSPAKKDRLLGAIPMSDEQFAKYRNERSKVLGKLLDNPQTIQRIKQMDPLTAQLFISQVTSAANQKAKAKLFMDDPSILEEAQEAKLKPK